MPTKLNLVRFFKLISKNNNFWQIITIFSSFRLFLPFPPKSSPFSLLHFVVGFMRISNCDNMPLFSRGNGNVYAKRWLTVGREGSSGEWSWAASSYHLTRWSVEYFQFNMLRVMSAELGDRAGSGGRIYQVRHIFHTNLRNMNNYFRIKT